MWEPKGCERVGTERVRTVQNRKGANGSGPKGCERFGIKRVRMHRHQKGANASSPIRCKCNINERHGEVDVIVKILRISKKLLLTQSHYIEKVVN